MNKPDKTSNRKSYINCNTFDNLEILTIFTPVNNKKPYLKQWQNNPKNISFCEDEIKRGKANGYGLITGNGLLAIDFDGANAFLIANAIGKWLTEIDTLTWTSGKPSRKQILVKIPDHRLNDFSKLTNKKIYSFGDIKNRKGDDGKTEQLEFRYKNSQSVLPPSAHPDTDGYYFVGDCRDIAQLTDYQCNSILSAIDTNIQNEVKIMKTELTNEQQLDLLEEALKYIPPENYQDWITVGMVLRSNGYDFSLWDKWSSTSSKYEPHKIKRSWDSFNGFGLDMGSLFLLAQQNGFNQSEWMRNYLKNNSNGNYRTNGNNNGNHKPEIEIDEAVEKIKEILQDASLSEIDQNIQLELLRQQANISEGQWTFTFVKPVKDAIIKSEEENRLKLALEEIRELIPQKLTRKQAKEQILIISDYYTQDSRQLEDYYVKFKRHEDDLDAELELSKELQTSIELENSSLNLDVGLPKQLATLIKRLSSAMTIEPEHLITALLPTWANGIGTKSQVVISRTIGYTQPAVIRSMIVGKSGDRKSPIIKVATQHLTDLENESYDRYLREYKQYELDLEEWESLKKSDRGPKPKKPIRTRYTLKDTNFEGMVKIHSQNTNGLLNIVDELKGYFSRMNKQHGKGDDQEKDLELFNGNSLAKDRQSEECSFYLKESAVSSVGGIQWDILKSLIQEKGENDSAGTIARWLICCKAMKPTYIDLFADDETLFDDFKEDQRKLFLFLRNDLPETDYLLSNDAKRLWMSFQHELEDLRQKEPIEAMAIAYPKFESYLSRIALILHCIKSYYSNEDGISPAISAETIKQAILFVRFFISQYRLTINKVSPAVEMTGDLLKIRDMLLKHKFLTSRKVKDNLKHLRKEDDKIRSYFKTLVDSDIATWDTKSRTMKILLSEDKCGKSAEKVRKNPNSPNSHKIRASEKTNYEVRKKCGKSAEKSNQDISMNIVESAEKNKNLTFSTDNHLNNPNNGDITSITNNTSNIENNNNGNNQEKNKKVGTAEFSALNGKSTENKDVELSALHPHFSAVASEITENKGVQGAENSTLNSALNSAFSSEGKINYFDGENITEITEDELMENLADSVYYDDGKFIDNLNIEGDILFGNNYHASVRKAWIYEFIFMNYKDIPKFKALYLECNK